MKMTMSHEDLPNWEFYSTSSTLESAVFPLLASTKLNVSAPESLTQIENHSHTFNASDLHGITSQEQTIPTSVCIPLSVPITEHRQRKNKKRKMSKHSEDHPIEFHKEKREDGMLCDRKQENSQFPKLRSAELRSAFERRRRNQIAGRMKTLQELLPSSDNKLDAASVLDKSIEYIRTLQHQVQNMCYGGNILRHASHLPLQGIEVPQIPSYFPIGAANGVMLRGLTNFPWSASINPAINQGFSRNLHEPLQSIQTSLCPAVYSSSEFLPYNHQVQKPVLNPWQQTAAAGFNVQPSSFPLMFNPPLVSFPTQGESASQVFCKNPMDYYSPNSWGE